MSPNPIPALFGEKLIGVGRFNATVASGANTVVLKAAPGRICRIVITAAGTVSFTVFDNASAPSGTELFASPLNTSVGQLFDLMMPATNGITISNPTNSPAMTISWD